MGEGKVRLQFGKDFPRSVDVFPIYEPVIRLLVAILEYPLSRNPSRQTVGQTTLARNHHRQYALFRVAHPTHLAYGCGKVRQMLQDVDGQYSIEMTVAEVQPFLTVSNDRVDTREVFSQLRNHVVANIHSHVLLLLRRRKSLVMKMLSDACPYLKRPDELLGRILNHISMIEVIDDAVPSRQDFMPILHEVVADLDLLRRKRDESLWPFFVRRVVHLKSGQRQSLLSCPQ